MVHHDIPGFHFDASKNRYFFMPNEKRARESKRYENDFKPSFEDEPSFKRLGTDMASSTILKGSSKDGLAGLIHRREITGHGRSSNSWQTARAFQGAYMEMNAAHFRVWEYDEDKHSADGGIEQLRVKCQTSDGEVEEDVLFVGGTNGTNGRLGIWHVKDSKGKETNSHVHKAHPCLPRDKASWGRKEKDAPLLQPFMQAISFPSQITSIKRLNEWSEHGHTSNGNLVNQKVIISTLGNGLSGGSVYIVCPSQSHSNNPWQECQCSHPFRLSLAITTNQSIWTAESSPRGDSACIGMNSRVALVDLERKASSWMCHSSSDALAQQFDSSGNIVICGFRNGFISTFDVRLPQSRSIRGGRDESVRLEEEDFFQISTTQQGRRVPYRRPSKRKHKFINSDNVGNIFSHAAVMRMKQAVCSLKLCRTNEWYLLASAMNGDIEQWDRRFVSRGPLRSYEGHCNSHSHLHLGMDPTERLLIAGGQDHAIRLWSLASGKLLNVERGLSSPAVRVSWPTSPRMTDCTKWGRFWEEPLFQGQHPWDVWMGSKSGLLHVRGSAR